MTPTEQLKEEHNAIKLMLKILDALSERMKFGKRADSEHLAKMLDFIKIFADKCHHGKEEDLLFSAMEEAGIPKEGGPIAVMLQEHNMGRYYIQELTGALVR